jgi:hypothetical protein
MNDTKDNFVNKFRKSSISTTRKTSDDYNNLHSSGNEEDCSVKKLDIKNCNNKPNLSKTMLDASFERILKTVEEAMIYKSKGNNSFKNKNYEEALQYFNKVK